RAIRDELADHLDARIDDLVAAGRSTADARDRAIAELGDAAAVARRFTHAARSSRRRRFMQFTALGLTAVAALTAGVVTFTPDPVAAPTAIFQPPPASDAGVDVFADDPVEFNRTFTLATFNDLLAHLAARPVVVHWSELADVGVSPDDELDLGVVHLPASTALRLVREELHRRTGATIDWRVEEDVIEVGFRETFDRQHTRLVAYDIRRTIDQVAAREELDALSAADRITDVLHDMVEPDQWRDRGGDVANLQSANGVLLIDAPDRMHERIRWILDVIVESDDADG
ncbi:MAG: hypothetical protein KDA25_06770, partial [Phycisphaerales bacterium]|nr:hypothetical protein [Phycisphaerales bacterium]